MHAPTHKSWIPCPIVLALRLWLCRSYQELLSRLCLSVWCAYGCFSTPSPDGVIGHENEELRDRVASLEKKVQQQDDEIVCLKSALSDAIRRLSTLESSPSSGKLVCTWPLIRYPILSYFAKLCAFLTLSSPDYTISYKRLHCPYALRLYPTLPDWSLFYCTIPYFTITYPTKSCLCRT